MRRAGWAILLGIAALCAWFAWMAVYQVDDAFIVYRYAANLARGEGFVFNPGERVEGVTCFLWTLVLAPWAAAGLRLPLLAPILTALAGCVVVLLLPFVSARIAGRPSPDLWDGAAAALLAAHPGFAYWSVGALETVPYALLLLLALRDQAAEQVRGFGRRSAVWMGAATLIRPEAPLLALAMAAGRVLDGPGRGGRARVRDLLGWSAIVLAVFVPLLLFRRLYFGDWLPNTYYARTGAGWPDTLHDGRVYTLGFLSSLAPGFGHHDPFTGAIGVGIILGLVAFGLPRPRLRSAALLVCALGLAVFLEGGDWMVLFRFWVPGLPAVMLLMVAAARAVVDEIPGLRPYAATLGVVVLASFLWAGHVARDGPNGLSVNAAGYRFAHDEVADRLKKSGRPGDTVALMDIGRIGYATGLPIIDISGLTDREIARAPGGFLHKQYPVERLLARAPRFFVLVEGFPIDEAILRDPGFVRDYRLVLERNHRFNWTPPESYTLRLYEIRSR
jgi:arabinofuranosyltransferase